MNFWRHFSHLFSPSCFASYSFNLLRFTSSKVAFSLLCKSYAVDEILQNVIRAMFWPASFFHHVHIVVSWKTRLHFISSEMQNQFLTRENFPVSGCRERQIAFRRYIIRLVIHRMLSTTFDEIEWTAIRWRAVWYWARHIVQTGLCFYYLLLGLFNRGTDSYKARARGGYYLVSVLDSFLMNNLWFYGLPTLHTYLLVNRVNLAHVSRK